MLGRSRTDSTKEPTRETETVAASSELSLDDVYHLLQTKRRRDVLRYLRGAEEPVRLRELAEQVAAWEQETSIDKLSSDERQRVYISLYQSHLPKLDNHGIVDYDKDRGRVETTSRTSQLDSYLEPPTETDSPDRWPQRYAGTTICCTLLIGAIATGLVPISGLVGSGLVLAAFTITTSVHVWSIGASRQ